MLEKKGYRFFCRLILIGFLLVLFADVCLAEEVAPTETPTGEILSNKWGFVVAAYALSWMALLGYLLSLYNRGLR